LRGDKPREEIPQEPGSPTFAHAVDLIKYIRQSYGDYFDIGVAGYPEGHPEAPDITADINYLKAKVNAGATFIITQMFYDIDCFLDWVVQCRKVGIEVPIIPGIMPITSWSRLQRQTRLMQTRIPLDWLEAFEPIKDDDAAVRDLGNKFVTELCRRILESGILQLHFYTMNLEKGTFMILDELEINSKNPLPWRQVPTLTPIPRSDKYSALHTAVKKKTSVQYSGRTATRVTSPAPKNGTNSPTAAGATHALPPTANSTSTASASNALTLKSMNGGAFPPPSKKSVPSLPNMSAAISNISPGATHPSALKSIPFAIASSA
jgi:hypothetical protein